MAMALIDKKDRKAYSGGENSSPSSERERGAKISGYAQKGKKYRIKYVQRFDGENLSGNVPKNNNDIKPETAPTGSKQTKNAGKQTNGANGNVRQSGNFPDRTTVENKTGTEPVSEISPEMEQRLKQAAYLEMKNQENIRVNTAGADHSEARDNAEDHSPHAPPDSQSQTSDKSDGHKSLSDKEESTAPAYEKTITAEMAARMKRAAYIEQKNAEAIRLNRAAAVKEAEQQQELFEERESTEENVSDVPVEHSEENVSESSEVTEADKRNNDIREYREKKAYSDFINAQNSRKLIHDAEKAGQTIKSSDSVGSAVMDLSATLAAVEAKKMVKKLAETDVKKQERVKERLNNHGNRYGIGSNSMIEEIRDKAEKIQNPDERYGASGDNVRHSKVGNGIKLQEEKREYAKEQRSKEIRNKQKEMYIKENRNIPETVVSSEPAGESLVKRLLKRKAMSVIMGGGAMAAVIPVLLAIAVYVLISSFFGWLSPFSFSLAGDDTVHDAETKAEVIDGYTLMVKNYLDVVQAYYYLNYGDWYGGVYAFESTDYSIADVLTPDESRQPYEVTATSGGNGIDDAEEFNDKPIVGTNNFGNLEINSDLSAEEMLAYIALYKSLITMNPTDTDDEEEMSLNITPQDIMDFFEKTEYIKITAEITHNNSCTGMDCKRRLIETDDGVYWEYYCDSDHDNLSGEISVSLTADELLDKIIELTGAEEKGIDAEQGQQMIDSYIEMFKEELEIDESEYRNFGASDNTQAKDFYEQLVTDSLSGGDIWDVDTPFTES